MTDDVDPAVRRAVERAVRELGDDPAGADVATVAGWLSRRGDPVPPAAVDRALAALADDRTPSETAETAAADDTDEPDADAATGRTPGRDAAPDRDADGYIRDPGFGDGVAAVREHYREARPVFDALARFGDEPDDDAADDRPVNIGFASNAGWYDHRPATDPDVIDDDVVARSRPTTWARDWGTIVRELGDDGDARAVYNLTSWDDPDTVFGRVPRDDAGDYHSDDHRDGSPTPEYSDPRAFGFWADVDLADELKPERGRLPLRTRATVERALDELAREVADLYGVAPADVLGLDSGGGAYLYGPPEAVRPVVEAVDDREARERIMSALRDRLTEWSREAWDRVADRVDGAASVLDPDFVQNVNRQSKAPLALHGDHDVVVTPLRPRDPGDGSATGDVSYTPTLASAVNGETVEATTAWADRLTAERHRDAAGPLFRTLFPDAAAACDADEPDAVAVARTWLRQQRHAEARREWREERARRRRRDRDGDGDGDAGAATADAVTPDRRTVRRATNRLDARDVAGETVVHQWTDSAPGLTDRSGEGNRAFVPIWGRNPNSGNANVVDEDRWHDSGAGVSGGPARLAAIAAADGPAADYRHGDRWTRDAWIGGLWELRRLGYDVPLYTPDATSTAPDGDQYDEMPLWALRAAAVALDVLEWGDYVVRDAETGDVVDDPHAHDGETYRGFPDCCAYRRAVAAAEQAGLVTGRDADDDPAPTGDDPDAGEIPTGTTLDPAVAHRAARSVTPDELALDVDRHDDESGAWACPRCDRPIDDAVRALAVDRGETPACPDCGGPLDAATYTRLYDALRQRDGVDVPRYVSAETTAETWRDVSAALDALTVRHFDGDALRSELHPPRDADGDDVVARIDPAYRDSLSGESVVLFRNGVVYDHALDETVRPLAFAALDAGALSWDEFRARRDANRPVLEGDTFRRAYATARLFGAPLPEWRLGEPDRTVVLPPHPDDQLDAEPAGDTDDRLDAARQRTLDAVRDAATDGGDPVVVDALPSLGKSRAAVAIAERAVTGRGVPTLYTAERRELRGDAAERAAERDMHWMYLPVFAGDGGPPDDVAAALDDALRAHGTGLLRERDRLRDVVEDVTDRDMAAVFDAAVDDESADGGGEGDGTDSAVPEPDDGTATCATASGDHDAATVEWWLAVHAARTRGFKPADIHRDAVALFGRPLPCQQGSGDCRYTEAWDTVRSADDPLDLLIGHPVHAHPPSARRLDYRDGDGDRVAERRAWLQDELPSEVWGREFGDEYRDYAAWLARSLSDAVDDGEDMERRRGELWDDDAVRAWLRGDSADGPPEPYAAAHRAAGRLRDAVQALLSGDADTLGDVSDPVDTLRTVIERDRVSGPLAALLADAADAAESAARRVGQGTRDDARIDRAQRLLGAAHRAAAGGRDGVEALAVWHDDPYVHPAAGALLYAVLAPADADESTVVETDAYGFDAASDTERLQRVDAGAATVVASRDGHGAYLHRPPATNDPVVGLDATARPELWETQLGVDGVALDGPHDSRAERREFLAEVYGLSVVQTSEHAHPYGGDPTSLSLTDDRALLREVTDHHDADPAVVTTLAAERAAGDALRDDGAASVDHYGDLRGSNRLASHPLGVMLGYQHHGDDVIEKWAALAGEQVHRAGHGMHLEYGGGDVAEAALRHMREDSVLQAMLRFGRDPDVRPTVYAHTAALRRDVPVVAEGSVVETYSGTVTDVADTVRELLADGHDRVASADVHAALDRDVTRRAVRDALARLADRGYVDRLDQGAGRARVVRDATDPGVGEAELPDTIPEQTRQDVSYTWSFRVDGGEPAPPRHGTRGVGRLPAPDTVDGGTGGGEAAPERVAAAVDDGSPPPE